MTHVEDYMFSRLNSAKVGVAQKTSKVAANTISAVIVFLLIFCSVLFFSAALAYLLYVWLGKMYWALLIVAGIYVLAAFIVWHSRERLLRLPIMNAILRELFDRENKES